MTTHVSILVANQRQDIQDQYAAELLSVAKKSSQEAHRVPGTKGSQDGGAIVEFVLNAAAVVTLAKGIADWLRLRHNATITIKKKANSIEVSATHITPATSVALIEAALREHVADSPGSEPAAS